MFFSSGNGEYFVVGWVGGRCGIDFFVGLILLWVVVFFFGVFLCRFSFYFFCLGFFIFRD